MHIFVILPLALVGAAAVRLRGDAIWARWTGLGVGSARGMCGVAFGAIAAAAQLASGWIWWLPLAVAAGTFAGFTLSTLGAEDAGQQEGTGWADAGWNLLRGAALAGGPGVALWLAGDAWLWMAGAGALVPAVYAVGWAVPSRLPHLATGIELSEALLGAVLAAGLALAILTG